MCHHMQPVISSMASAPHLQLIERDVTVRVLVEDLEGGDGLFSSSEAVSDIVDVDVGAGVRAKGEEDPTSELAGLVARRERRGDL